MITINKGIIPLTILGTDDAIPDEFIGESGLHLVQQGQNLFTLKNSPFHSTLSPSKVDIKAYFEDTKYKEKMVYVFENRMKSFKFKVEDFQYAMKYLQWIYDSHKAEGALLLLANAKKKEWKLLPVLQISASGAAVTYIQPLSSSEGLKGKDKYVMEQILEDRNFCDMQMQVVSKYNEMFNDGWQIMGTVHSHCNFSAFHSGVDDHDEKQFNGLHITIGNVRSGWSYSARYMLEGASFKVNIEEILGITDMKEVETGVDNITLDDFDKQLMIKIKPAPSLSVGWLGYNKKHDNSNKKHHHFFGKNLFSEKELEEERYFPYVDACGYLVNTKMLNYNENQEYKANVFEETDLIIIEHKESGYQLSVTEEYYQQNQEMFMDYVPEDEVDSDEYFNDKNPNDPQSECGVKESPCVIINSETTEPSFDGQGSWAYAKVIRRKATKIV